MGYLVNKESEGNALIGHATNSVTSLAVSLQHAVLPVTVSAAGMSIAYSVGDGCFDVARVVNVTPPAGTSVVSEPAPQV
jgi:hypothetical protein